MPIPYEDLITLGDLLAQQQDARPSRRFPSVAALLRGVKPSNEELDDLIEIVNLVREALNP